MIGGKVRRRNCRERMKRTKIRVNTYRYDSPRGFGIVQFQGVFHPTGTDWYARLGFFQKKPSIGDKLKIKQADRAPRWKTLGHFDTLKLADAAMREALKQPERSIKILLSPSSRLDHLSPE